MIFKLSSKKMHFDAAHFLPNHPGLCKNLHGHTWTVQAHLEATRNTHTGMVLDLKLFHEALKESVDYFDHVCVNELATADDRLHLPTAENIANFIWDSVASALDAFGGSMLFITVQEGEGGSVTCHQRI